MKKVSTLSKCTLLGAFLCFCNFTMSQDFNIQHIQDDVARTGGTNTSFTAVSSTASAFALPANNKMTHAGRSDSNNGTLEGDDMAGARVLTGTGTLTYYREGASVNSDMNFQSTIWEYTGAPGGANEFIVRGRYAVALNGTTSGTAVDITASGISNKDNVIPFITGILNDDTNNGADSASAIAWLSSTTNMEVRKGTRNNNVTIYITLVEFTGANWTVLHGISGGDSANTGSISLTTDSDGSGSSASVSSWSNAIIFTQSKAHTFTSGNVKEYVNAQWPIIAPGSDNQTVDWTFDSGRGTATSGAARNRSNHLVHVLENSEIGVTRYTNTSSADNESTIDITSASLTALNQAMIIGTSISSGLDTEYGRSWRNYYLNSTTQAAHWSHRSGSTMSHNIQIVNFDPPATQTEGPGGITANLELWLKANEGAEQAASVAAVDTDPVLNWLDNSVNTNDATQATLGNRPLFNQGAINFNPAIDYDGTNHELLSTITTNSTMTIFTVGEGTLSGTNHILNLRNAAGSGSLCIEQNGATSLRARYNDGTANSGTLTSAIVSGTPFIANYDYFAGSNSEFFDDGASSGTASTNANTLDASITAGIGTDHRNSARRWNGGIAEVIVYTGSVTAPQRDQIESYLAIKYGITLGVNGTSQDYVDSDGTPIWDQSANSGYNYNVTGIGRDDTSELEQKQSKSINTTDDITVGIKEIATSNEGNTTNFFEDKTFLMWGHNNGATTAGTDITKDFSSGIAGITSSVSATPIQRIWKMVVTDTVPTIKLSIPESMVSATNPGGEDYIMIISDNAAFTSNVTSATMEDVGTELEVDFYIEGTKYITFGSAPETDLGSRAATFDRTDKYISAGDVNDLANTDYTISAWVKRNPGSGKFDVVSKRNYFNENTDLEPGPDVQGTYTHGYAFRINATNQFRMVWRDPADTKNQIMETTETIPEDEWHHIAATHDFSENMTILYIDGIQVYDSDDFFADKGVAHDPMNVPSDAHFMIGAAEHKKRQQKLGGSVDEVRVWNVALSANQLRYIMNQEIEENGSLNADGKILPSATTLNDIDDIPWNNLIAYYPMSTAVFGSIKDESNSGNDASMINYDLLDEQTAPLPYKTTQNGDWDTSTTWENGDVQYLPGGVSFLYASEADADKETMDYNIVQIDDEVTIDNTDTSIIPAYKNDNRTLLGLTISATGDLEVTGDTSLGTGNSLTVSHYLKLDGTLDLEGESQLIQTTDSDLDVTSSGALERDQQGTKDLYTYNYWSSPVSLINTATNNTDFRLNNNIIKNGTVSATPNNITFLTSSYNGSVSGTDIEIADYWVWKYVNSLNNDYSQWAHVRSTGSISVGEGFTMKGVESSGTSHASSQNYVFYGKPNNGDITLPITVNNEYLIGNPYPSALDADEFIKDNISDLETDGRNTNGNIINGVLYFWDHFASGSHYLSDYQGGYATYTLMGGAVAISNDVRINANGTFGTTTPGRYVPVGQGFFVSAILDIDLNNDGEDLDMDMTPDPDPNDPALTEAIVGGTLIFKNSQRVFQKEGSAASIFVKSGGKKNRNTISKNTTGDDRQKIKLMLDSPDGYHRQLLVGADEKCSNNFDMGYDAPLIETNKEDMYWVFNNANFIIQAVNDFNEDQVLPLGIKINKAGIAKIKIDALENISEGKKIIIHDKELGTYKNLTEGNFETYLEPGTYSDRFELLFSNSLLSSEEIEDSNLNIYFANETEAIVILNPEARTIKDIELYNILGQSVNIFKTNSNKTLLEHKINPVNTGIYIIKLHTENGTVSKKIIVK